MTHQGLVSSHSYQENNFVGLSWPARLLLGYAWVVAHVMHLGQVRRTGDAYIKHPQALADLLRRLHLSVFDQAAALLHDTIEENKGVRKLIAIILVLFAGPLVAGMVFVLTKWSDDEEQYFRQILWWSRIFKHLPIFKLADKVMVLSTPLMRSKEKTIHTMKKVLSGGSFADLIEKGRKYTSPQYLQAYNELFTDAQREAQQQLAEAES